MKKYLKIGIMMVAISAWCGMMYPELSFTDGILCVLKEDGTKQPLEGAEAYYDFFCAGTGQLEIRSSLFEAIENIR